MTEKQYIITLAKGVDATEFCTHMESDTTSVDCGCIPDRTVDVSNRKPASKRSTEYSLTDSEANHLKDDPRVIGVEIDLGIDAKASFAEQIGNYTRSQSKDASWVNWGLRRCTQSAAELSPGNSFPYNLDGTGVDIVIQDNGVMTGHPEWEDADGNSRFVELDWYTATGTPGTMPVSHYGDVGDHGTHVAGIAAGKTYGWAKNARIYSIRYDVMPTGDEFDLIRLWHEQKPIDPVTGFKRPTVVNASWGYRWWYPGTSANQTGNITEVNYRGTNTGTTLGSQYGNVNLGDGRLNIAGYSVIDAALEDLTDAGVIYVKAAGNYFHKQDVLGGADYDNFFTCDVNWATGIIPANSPVYYHRPGSPISDDSIVVANAAESFQTGTTEQLASSSEKGPRIDMCAPGQSITSATNSTGFGSLYDNTYPLNSNYKISRIGGTSMASPQVAGVLACYMQINPNATSQQLKNWLIGQSQSNMYTGTGTGTDYSDSRSLQGAPNRMLYTPFVSPIQARIFNA